MRNFAIHGRELSESSVIYFDQLIKLLQKHEVEVAVSEVFNYHNSKLVKRDKLNVYHPFDHDETFDVVCSIGGDGTFLETLTHVGKRGTPILGINTGRLGFLATTSKEDLNYAVESVINGDYTIDKRSLVGLEANVDLFHGLNFALNEFSILRKETSTMIVVKTFLDGEYLNSYWSDGLMVATPTGSTGYSLSCGGPIIAPDSKNLVITPVSPHNLNIRPLVIPDSSEITFEVESRNKSFLVSLDSRSQTAEGSVELKVRKAAFTANLVRITGSSFVDTLRTKLSWGLDKRN